MKPPPVVRVLVSLTLILPAVVACEVWFSAIVLENPLANGAPLLTTLLITAMSLLVVGMLYILSTLIAAIWS